MKLSRNLNLNLRIQVSWNQSVSHMRYRKLQLMKQEPQLYADILFPELEREFQRNPGIVGNTYGLLEVKILKQGSVRGHWYILFQGRSGNPPTITTHEPKIATGSTVSKQQPTPRQLATKNIPLKSSSSSTNSTSSSSTTIAQMKRVKVELEDKDLLKMITGGMNGIKAYTQKRLKISGDLELAREIEKIFVKAGGVKKVMAYIRANYPQSKL